MECQRKALSPRQTGGTPATPLSQLHTAATPAAATAAPSWNPSKD